VLLPFRKEGGRKAQNSAGTRLPLISPHYGIIYMTYGIVSNVLCQKPEPLLNPRKNDPASAQRAKERYRVTTDILLRAPASPVQLLARALGKTENHLYRARNPDDARTPPPGWEREAAQIAADNARAMQIHAAELARLAEDLDAGRYPGEPGSSSGVESSPFGDPPKQGRPRAPK
jgi:hypothetical protein